jgi:hypothetical protein
MACIIAGMDDDRQQKTDDIPMNAKMLKDPP